MKVRWNLVETSLFSSVNYSKQTQPLVVLDMTHKGFHDSMHPVKTFALAGGLV